MLVQIIHIMRRGSLDFNDAKLFANLLWYDIVLKKLEKMTILKYYYY